MTDEPREAAAGDIPHEPTRLQRAKKTYDLVSDVLTPTRLLVAAAAVVALIVGLIGGWENVAAVEEQLPEVRPSTATTATPWELTVKSARHGNELTPIAYASDGMRYLFVTAEVTLRSDQPVDAGVLADAVAIDAPGLQPTFGTKVRPSVYRLSDALSQRFFQPNVTVPVVFVWSQDSTDDVPAELTVTLNRHTWKKSTLEDYHYWQEPTAVGTVRLTVAEIEAEQ